MVCGMLFGVVYVSMFTVSNALLMSSATVIVRSGGLFRLKPVRWCCLCCVVVPTNPACTWWNRPEEDPSSGKLESTHPSRTSVKSDPDFLVSSQSWLST